MKKLLALLLIAAMVLGLAGCSGYVSSYRATILITSGSGSDRCSLSADSFDGKYVFHLRHNGKENALSFSASVGEGSVTVSYAVGQDETVLCSLQSGQAVTDHVDLPENLRRGTIYVIIRTDGKAKDLKVNVETGAENGNYI